MTELIQKAEMPTPPTLQEARQAQGAIEVPFPELVEMYHIAQVRVYGAIARLDYESARRWREEEANIASALRGQGYIPRPSFS